MKIIQLIALLLVFSASLAQKKGKKTIVTIPSAPGIVFEVGKGEILEGAIKIKFAKDTKEGVNAETKYLTNLYGELNVDCKPFGSEFYNVNGKIYNLINIEFINKDGKTKDEFTTIYFDVTDCNKK